jgi:hypothetical protein
VTIAVGVDHGVLGGQIGSCRSEIQHRRARIFSDFQYHIPGGMVDVPRGAIDKNYETPLLQLHAGLAAWGVTLVSSTTPECSSKALGGRAAGLMDGAGISSPSTGMSQGSLQTTTSPTPHHISLSIQASTV